MSKPSFDVLTLVIDLARLIRTEADRRARTHGMTRAQWVILGRLKTTPGLSQRELAEILEVEPITVGRLVDRLEARNMVERRPDSEDRRIWRLHLGPEADDVLEALERQREAIALLVNEGVEPAEMAPLVSALTRMKANVVACRRSPPGNDLKETA